MSRNWLIPISLSSIVLLGSSAGCRPIWFSPQEEGRRPAQVPEMSSGPEVSEKGEPSQRSGSGATLEATSSSFLQAQALTHPSESG
ncbi:MAG: hypothetical protein VKL39_05765, partial [Leptolyngbyaceae bacterium]|nr:hypothetical protein [Leptolyngbyaceae bacterium]